MNSPTSDLAPGPGSRPALLRAFGVTRAAIGLTAWLAPNLATRMFGLGPRSEQPIVAQLFGVRELILGLLTAAGPGEAQRAALRIGIAVDSADAVASLRQIGAGRLSPTAKLLVGAGAATFAGIGAAAVATDPGPTPV